MSDLYRGLVININAFGATVRLEDGRIAGVPLPDLERHRAEFERGLTGRKQLEFEIREQGRHVTALIAPQLHDDRLEEQIAGYLKETEAWEPTEGPPAHERHFLRKKKRAALFESRHAE